jgi:2-methylcitrate dehydratase
MKKIQTAQMAAFTARANFDNLEKDIIDQLKKHLLDSLGSFLFAIKQPTIQKLLNQIRALGEGGNYQVPVLGKISMDRAAQLYTALIRYPDFMDNFLGKEATCHPSDNIGALLALSQVRKTSGRDFLTAMAIGYETECRLIEEVPVMIKGFDHTALLGYSLTAAICKLMDLSEVQTAHALGIAGSSINPLVTSRASYTYEWKGLASSLVAKNCVGIALLAKEGMTGPLAVFEGPKGFHEIYGMELKYDWLQEDFSLIRKCILKSYNSEVHTQPSLEAVLELKHEHVFSAADIEEVDITTFLTSYHIVGGGAYGDRKKVFSKEQADHSLPYVVAVALLDGQVYPAQLTGERINKSDVQELLLKVNVHTGFPLHKPLLLAGILDPYTAAYPEKLISKAEIRLKNGKKLSKTKEGYHGFHTRPFSWEDTEKKFLRLTGDIIPEALKKKIIHSCMHLDKIDMAELLQLLCSVK